MGKRGGYQKIATSVGASGGAANNGKKQSKASLLKLQHLHNLAVWASGDADVPSLGAFFGNRFAACQEVIGVQPDQSLFTCERCETILHPGDNCTVRIEKNNARKRQKHRGSKALTQNNVVYKCHFCSHQTIKRGTVRGHMKQICPPKDKPAPKPRVRNALPLNSTDTELCMKNCESTPTSIEHLDIEPCAKISENASPVVEVAIVESPNTVCKLDTSAPVTPLVGACRNLLDRKKRTRNKPGSKKDPESSSAKIDVTSAASGSKKRRRKTSISLKDLAKSSQVGNSRNLSDLTIPFFL